MARVSLDGVNKIYDNGFHAIHDLSLDIDDYGFFDKGDTVTLKFCNIDHSTYDIWRTADFAYSSAGNPFASPTRTLGNVKGALGYWGGYSITYRTIIIPK